VRNRERGYLVRQACYFAADTIAGGLPQTPPKGGFMTLSCALVVTRPSSEPVPSMTSRRCCAMVIGQWLAGCVLLSSCAAPEREYPMTAIGVREWIGPGQGGTLDLRRDGTFVLSIESRQGDSGRLTGTWTWHTSRSWPAVKYGMHDPGDPGMVNLLVGATAGTVHDTIGTSLGAVLDTGCATYLGTNGVVDLYWGG
jgi:hypothetical protein